MPNPNAIVGRVERLEPSLGEEVILKRLDRETTVHFTDGRIGRLNPADPLADAYARVLENLRRRRDPAYVEVEPVSKTITRLLLPTVVLVKSVTPAATREDFEVELEISHVLHVLRRETPFFGDMLEHLQRAQERHTPVLMTETRDDHSIIDVREVLGPFAPFVSGEAEEVEEIEEECLLLSFPSLRAVSPQRLQELFDLIDAEKCDAYGRPALCIPFLYPDDGCWARAHAAYEMITGAGEHCGKVWIHAIQGTLSAATRNHPTCMTPPWTWHVAPVLRVSMGGTTEPWVIEPALFSKPVPLSTLLGAFGNPYTKLVWTVGSVFYRNSVCVPSAQQSDIESVLQPCRDNLLIRSQDPGPPPGPPPYAQCP